MVNSLNLNAYQLELLKNRFLQIRNSCDLQRRIQWYNLLKSLDDKLQNRTLLAKILSEEYNLIGYSRRSIGRFLSRDTFYKLGTTYENGY